MVDFNTLLRRGKKRSTSKDDSGYWGKCDACDERKLLYIYVDNYDKKWNLCSGCINAFADEEIK